MRYSLIAETQDEQFVQTSPRGPRAAFDTLLPLLQVKAIMIASKLSVFESLRRGRHTSASIATEHGLDTTTLEIVLRVLACAGYVTWNAGHYELTPLARASLLDGGPATMKSLVALHELMWEHIGSMDEVVRNGVGFDLHATLSGPDRWATYQTAMLETARTTAPLVAAMVPVKPGSRRLLDVGGSHGLYGAHICRAHPPLVSEVFDLPFAIETAKRLAFAEGISGIVTHRAGDARTDDFGDDYDVVLLSNVLHHLPPAHVQEILMKVRRALNPEGTVAIWEMQAPGFDAPPDLVGDGFALFFRMTSTTPCYTAATYQELLRVAGFADLQIRSDPLVPFQALITGVNRP